MLEYLLSLSLLIVVVLLIRGHLPQNRVTEGDLCFVACGCASYASADHAV